ncbi:extracellular solute-binding protein [Micromonospora sp. NPDC049559]|uniref:ABC transporter substrate-binding protein n=1 Tax=Micromonospora sp. NPDC049559 TaxID=3155923 RepID=UPI0034430999
MADRNWAGETGAAGEDGFAEEVAATLAQAGAALPAVAPDAVGLLRARYRRIRRRRARLATATVAVLVLTVSLAGVALVRGPHRRTAPAGPPAGVPAGVIRVWTLATTDPDSALRRMVDRYNRTAEVPVELSTFANDEYKERLRTMPTGPAAPDVLMTWGGERLTRLAREGRLAELTGPGRQQPEVAGPFLPRVLAGGAVDGRQYGLPMSGTQPVLLFYHRGLFAQAGLRPPTTYPELLALVDAFASRGVTPIALGGAQGWTELMYLMYLVERIGGAAVARQIALGRPGAWSDPAVLAALRTVRDLVARGAFGTDFGSLGYDDGAASARFATGRAAMQLMGSWEYQNQLARHPEVVRDGDLGWVPFPAVPGGAGDPAAVVGVPAHFLSVSAASPHREAATAFVRGVASDEYLDALVATGEVPPVTDPARLRGTAHAPFATAVHGLVSRAPDYDLAWDLTLPPGPAAALNTGLQRLFRAELTPERFVAEMAATTG